MALAAGGTSLRRSNGIDRPATAYARFAAGKLGSSMMLGYPLVYSE